MDEVYITDELYLRPAKQPNYLREKQALQELASRIAHEPAAVLPKFVELAMELTGGVSAGLSLYEPDPAPGIFRWTHLYGSLARFNGATTPRNNSPCGVTLDRCAPTVTRHSERAYDWIAEVNVALPEVLLVPLFVGGKTLGTLWIVADEISFFDREDVRLATELATFVGIALQMTRAEQALQQALEEQLTLTGEMGHRVKNLFALVDSMIRMAAKDGQTKEEYAKSLSARVHALASANSLVRRTFSDAIGAPDSTQLEDLIRVIVLPYESEEGAAQRFTIRGPDILCREQATNGIALIMHELATNAAKYGALSGDQGRVSIDWRIDGDSLLLDWWEQGGPHVTGTPTAKGFGSKLVETMATQQFRGRLERDWAASGLRASLVMALNTIAR